jgi:glycosyltransferase involved in cell wall biosynthesis
MTKSRVSKNNSSAGRGKEFHLYPKVLVIVREPFNNVCGAGITMTSLFTGWPKERIASIYWQQLKAEKGVCEKYYVLTEREMRWRFPLKGLLSPKARQEEKELLLYLENKNESSPQRPTLKALARKSWRYLIRTIGGLGFMLKIDISNDLADWIYAFKPDVIYCSPTDLASISFIEKAANLSGASVITHVYDDWPSIVKDGGILEEFYGRKTTQAFTHLLKRSAYRFAICEEMAAEFKQRYGMEFLSFHNSPDSHVWLNKSRTAFKKESIFLFRFIGEIYMDGNVNVLRELSLSIAWLQRSGIDASLEIFSNVGTVNEFRNEFNIKNIVSINKVPDDSKEVASLYSSADGLIMAYDFHEYSAGRFRFSMPTKFPTYLLSGTPIVLYAPGSLSITRRMISQGIGYVIDQHMSIEQLSNRLASFIGDKQLRMNMSDKGKRYALDHLTADVMRPRFHKVLSNVPDVNPRLL